MASSLDKPYEETDLGTLWQGALLKYYGTDLRTLPASRLNMANIQAEQEHQLLLFSEYRHNKGKLDKLRSLVAQNSDRIIGVAAHIANAASAAFPPSGYREEAVADVHTTIIKLWELLFQTKFTKKSGRRLVLILDAVDETAEVDRKYVEMILEDVSRSHHLNIQVLFVSDPGSFAPVPEIKVQQLEITKELILPDIRAIIVARLRSLVRLRQLPQQVKRKIITRLSKQADTKRYVEHMLRALDQLGRSETAVLRQLKNLPSCTSGLYQITLEECQRSRTDQELVILRKFFAWLAYSAETLYLGCARRLLNHIATDGSINIDEELDNRCARILCLSNTTLGHNEEDDDDSDANTSQSGDEIVENDGDDFVDFFSIVRFQENGHAIILDTIRSILCTDMVDQTDYRGRALHNNAAKGWAWHLQAINQAELSEEETACVVESIYSILSNKGGSLRKMESLRLQRSTRRTCVLGETDKDIEKMIACLQAWALRAARVSSRVSGAAAAWMSFLVRNPEALFIRLAEAHVTNWLASHGHVDDWLINNCYLFAHYALYRGRQLPPVQQNRHLRAYFAEHADGGDVSSSPANEESFIVISRAFPHIDMTAQAYLSVAVAMLYNGLQEACLKQLDLAIGLAKPDIERMEINMRKAQVRIILLGEGGVESPAQKHDQWRKEALDAVTKAAEIASTLSESAIKDSKVQRIAHDIWMTNAKADMMIGDTSNTVAYCRLAVQIRPEDYGSGRFDILGLLAQAKSWGRFLEVAEILSGASWVASIICLEDYMDEMHSAAKATGEIDYVLEQYRSAVSGSEFNGANESRLMVNWARFYTEVIGTSEATSKAKGLLNKAIDTKGSTHYSAASFLLSDILLEEFRGTTQLEKKMAAYSVMRDVVKRVSESMGSEFNPSQSQTIIPLAHMARRMDVVEFQQGLERTFDGCVAALTDEAGWNNAMSLRMLARVLALVGMEREAQIAATCQLYVPSIDILSRGRDGQGDRANDLLDSALSDSDSEDANGGLADGDMNWDTNTGSVICSDCNKLIRQWSQGPVYLCYYCADVDLCQGCFDKHAERLAGKPSDDWRVLCRTGHRHIQMPVRGWKSLMGGVMKIEDTTVSFHDWLVEVKETKWPDAWARFWSSD